MWLIALKGFAGSGKSTLGRALGRELSLPVVDKDDILDILDGRAPDANRLAYDVMFNVARRQLLQGSSVLLDSPLNYGSLYDSARRLAAGTGARLAVIECRCPDEDSWKRRIDDRKALGLPAHHQTDWESFRAYHQRVLPEAAYLIADPHLVLDTTRPLAGLLAEVAAWLREQAGSEKSASERFQSDRPAPGAPA